MPSLYHRHPPTTTTPNPLTVAPAVVRNSFPPNDGRTQRPFSPTRDPPASADKGHRPKTIERAAISGSSISSSFSSCSYMGEREGKGRAAKGEEEEEGPCPRRARRNCVCLWRASTFMVHGTSVDDRSTTTAGAVHQTGRRIPITDTLPLILSRSRHHQAIDTQIPKQQPIPFKSSWPHKNIDKDKRTTAPAASAPPAPTAPPPPPPPRAGARRSPATGSDGPRCVYIDMSLCDVMPEKNDCPTTNTRISWLACSDAYAIEARELATENIQTHTCALATNSL